MGIVIVLVIVIVVILFKVLMSDATGEKTVSNSDGLFHYNREVKLSENPKIIDMNSEVVGLKNERYYKTVIKFDDYSYFISKKTKVEHNIATYTISIDASLRNRIIQDAEKAHKVAYHKQNKIDAV